MSTDLHCTVLNCQCPHHAAALAYAQAGTKKQNDKSHNLSASERRSLNPLIGHGYEELVLILRTPEPVQEGLDEAKENEAGNQHAFAMHAILVRFPGQDIKVMNRALRISSNTHEKDAIHLAIEFVKSAREANQGFHIDSLLPKQSLH